MRVTTSAEVYFAGAGCSFFSDGRLGLESDPGSVVPARIQREKRGSATDGETGPFFREKQGKAHGADLEEVAYSRRN